MGPRLHAFAIAAALFALPSLAFSQVLDPECEPPRSTTEMLLADLAAIPLPPGCAPVDFKAITNRIKGTPHISAFAKLRLGLRAIGLFDDAKTYDREKQPEQLAKLRRDYEELGRDFVEKLEGRDAELVRDLGCMRGAGLDILLKGAALENKKDRDGG